MSVPNSMGMAAQVVLMMTMSAVAGNRYHTTAVAASGYNEVVVVISAIDPIMGLAFGANSLLSAAFGADPRHPQLIPLAQRALMILFTFSVLIAVPLLLVTVPILKLCGMDSHVANLVNQLNWTMIPYPFVFSLIMLVNQMLMTIKQSKYVTLPSLVVCIIGPLLLSALTRDSSTAAGFSGLAYAWLLTAVTELFVTLAWLYKDSVFNNMLPRREAVDDTTNKQFTTKFWDHVLSPKRAFQSWYPLLRVMVPSMLVIVGGWAAMEVAFLVVAPYLSPCLLATNVIIHQVRFAFAPLPVGIYLAVGTQVSHHLGCLDGDGAYRLAKRGALLMICILCAEALIIWLNRTKSVHFFLSRDECVAEAFVEVLPWCLLECAIEQLAWFHIILLRTLDRNTLAVIITMVSWWAISLPFVFIFAHNAIGHSEQNNRTQVAINTAIFTGCLVGQIINLLIGAYFVWVPPLLGKKWTLSKEMAKTVLSQKSKEDSMLV